MLLDLLSLTPPVGAARRGHIEVVKTLLAHGADPRYAALLRKLKLGR